MNNSIIKSMAELSESIKLSKQVKELLDELKESGGHSSYDSVLRSELSIKTKRKVKK